MRRGASALVPHEGSPESRKGRCPCYGYRFGAWGSLSTPGLAAPWTSPFSSPGLSVLICKMGTIMAPSTRTAAGATQCCFERNQVCWALACGCLPNRRSACYSMPAPWRPHLLLSKTCLPPHRHRASVGRGMEREGAGLCRPSSAAILSPQGHQHLPPGCWLLALPGSSALGAP